MAQVRSAASTLSVSRVAVIAPTHIGDTAIAALRARGLDARAASRSDSLFEEVVAWALETSPTATAAVELAQTCERAAATGRPVCLLAPQPRGSGRAAIERAAGLAYLRAHGAAVSHDIDAWLEAVVALVRFGMPTGPRAAVIAPPGSWLEAQALAIVADAEATGARPPVIGRGKADEPTDVVLFDPALGPPPASLPGLHVPVIARAELGSDAPALYGARDALNAFAVLGRAAARITVGTGPAPQSASASLEIDRDRLARQSEFFGHLPAGMRVGDHETKVLLASYGVPVTRQIQAQTPSAAVKAARKVGFPVELKPWGHAVPTEPEGCPIERNVTSDALVRRAFSAVLAAAGRPSTHADPGVVIVREAPPQGRDLKVIFLQLPALGWTVVLDAPGAQQIAAAPAPLRVIDAEMLAATVVASRSDDPDPDRTGLANLLRRASHLVVDLGARIQRLELPRVVVGSRGSRSVVVDSWSQIAD